MRRKRKWPPSLRPKRRPRVKRGGRSPKRSGDAASVRGDSGLGSRVPLCSPWSSWSVPVPGSRRDTNRSRGSMRRGNGATTSGMNTAQPSGTASERRERLDAKCAARFGHRARDAGPRACSRWHAAPEGSAPHGPPDACFRAERAVLMEGGGGSWRAGRSGSALLPAPPPRSVVGVGSSSGLTRQCSRGVECSLQPRRLAACALPRRRVRPATRLRRPK